MRQSDTQRSRARILLQRRGMMRLKEFRAAGISAATMSRMLKHGEVIRPSRGLYQLVDAPLHAHQSLAEAAKKVPRGVICLVSALAYHGLTDQLPHAVWIAIGKLDWAPILDNPPIRIVRFTDAYLVDDVMMEHIAGVEVRIYGVAKTLADCFRHRRTVGQSVALDGLREALRQRKCTPAAIARHAKRGGVATVVRPYLEALTSDA